MREQSVFRVMRLFFLLFWVIVYLYFLLSAARVGNYLQRVQIRHTCSVCEGKTNRKEEKGTQQRVFLGLSVPRCTARKSRDKYRTRFQLCPPPVSRTHGERKKKMAPLPLSFYCPNMSKGGEFARTTYTRNAPYNVYSHFNVTKLENMLYL